MKRLGQISGFTGICLFLIACSQVTQTTLSPDTTPLPTMTMVPSQTATASSASTPTQISTMPIPAIGTPDVTNISSPTPKPNIPTLLPTIESNLVPDLLRKSISLQSVESVNGQDIRLITGWGYGFQQSLCDSYQWLDSNHLLLRPRTGQGMRPTLDARVRGDLSSKHVVINLANGSLWLRPPSSISTYEWDCDTMYWSQELGILINQERYGSAFGPVKEAVFTYTYDGQHINQYWGKILGVSPKGTKILVDDDTIIDLRDNKISDLAWYMNYDLEVTSTLYWSSDETKVYRCCFYYADLVTGKSFGFTWGDLHEIDGKPVSSPALPHSYGQWVRNDTYFLVEWNYFYDYFANYIPMFSPAEMKYYDIAAMAGIPKSAYISTATYAVSPDGMHVWIEGYGDDGQYHAFLVNLTTFRTVSYNESINNFKWSPDSKFAWMTTFDSSDIYILSISGKALTHLPISTTTNLSWHPTDHMLAFLTEKNRVFAILDVADMSVTEMDLPTAFRSFTWSPNGERIAFIAENGSIWQVEYPNLENFEQITPLLPAVEEVKWSPDDEFIAFISGSDIFIVDTTK